MNISASAVKTPDFEGHLNLVDIVNTEMEGLEIDDDEVANVRSALLQSATFAVDKYLERYFTPDEASKGHMNGSWFNANYTVFTQDGIVIHHKYKSRTVRIGVQPEYTEMTEFDGASVSLYSYDTPILSEKGRIEGVITDAIHKNPIYLELQTPDSAD